MPVVHVQKVSLLPRMEYFQLPEASRPAARQAVLDQELKALRRNIREVRTRAQQNINVLVNDRYHVERILRHQRHIRTLSDVPRFERYIEQNVCHFLADGTYVTYN